MSLNEFVLEKNNTKEEKTKKYIAIDRILLYNKE